MARAGAHGHVWCQGRMRGECVGAGGAHALACTHRAPGIRELWPEHCCAYRSGGSGLQHMVHAPVSSPLQSHQSHSQSSNHSAREGLIQKPGQAGTLNTLSTHTRTRTHTRVSTASLPQVRPAAGFPGGGVWCVQGAGGGPHGVLQHMQRQRGEERDQTQHMPAVRGVGAGDQCGAHPAGRVPAGVSVPKLRRRAGVHPV